MLTRWARRAALLMAGALAAGLVAMPAAWADGKQVCTPDGSYCWIEAETPGGPGSGGDGDGGDGGGSSGTAPCYYDGQRFPCTQDGWGYFNESDGCYYVLESPQPPAGDEAWEGHEPGDGSVYRQRCFGDIMGFLVWRATPPPGQPGTITPEELAARAMRAIPMGKPAIGIAPRTNGAGLVGLPVWTWVTNRAAAWGPVERTASVPGLAVTARAEVSSAKWWWGDGETCTTGSPGVAYKREFGLADDPDCGHRYAKTGEYTVTVTTTWTIDWWVVGGGAEGSSTVFRQASTDITIDELQVVRS
ncbi:hypothetical protein ACTI_38010 [Actinoplanes sp. OR16]|uniref:ATP/GTP-binding protein n=1 Tax=Actinoplanes sp. OR16 TaxID=946334 RepID=UPI000F702F6E|nr:ATP/GTP-binding protein [Actinoplanes sp. OR16]BBH67116.1 hypothetical protein ACTI_38010 [Actinoplanes sp. OR16]